MLGAAVKQGALHAFLLLPTFASSLQNSTGAASEATGLPPCDALISAGLSDRVLLATSNAYEPRVQSWWSANGRLRPWCFFQPHNTQEVSLAITALADSGSGAGDWHIAVRSGGHGNPGTNNIAHGVTIDFGMMNGSSYDPVRKLASVEPGAKWKNIYADLLRSSNVTVTGGRDGDVGVGGFLLGGGNSYYTGRNGFGCDTVVNYEVVLANGTIVQANANENHNLWKALKGGALNFGLVTRFDLEAMPAVDLAHGESFISSNYSDQVIDALVQFTDHQEERRDDHLITVHTHTTESPEDITILAVRVNTKGDLNTTSFDGITKIPTLTSSWARKSLADAAEESQVKGGLKTTGATLTFLNSPSMLRKAASLHKQLISSLSEKIGAENFMTQMFFQPLPTYLSTIEEAKGGNVLGLGRLPSNAILYTGGVGIIDGDDAAVAFAQAELSAMTAKLKASAEAESAAAEFIYLNYADTSQDPLGSYGSENVAFMRDVAKQYDPQGWWQRRVPGGFKISRVTA